MKRIFLILLLLPLCANAAGLSTSCPSGAIMINEEHMTVATSCPSGTVSAGTADSCLVESPSGSCIMYVPAGVTYLNDVGEYKYTEPCALK